MTCVNNVLFIHCVIAACAQTLFQCRLCILPGCEHCTSHFLATMDLKTLRKFRNLLKDVGSRLQGFTYRASLSDMLDVCHSVQASPNGTPIVFPACTPILHFSDYCHVVAVYSPPWGLVDGVLFVDMCFVVCIEGLSILSGYGRVPECETSGF